MTVEIRELIIQAEVTESSQPILPLPSTGYADLDEQRWVEKIKQEVLEHLLERGSL
ncbi:DUF5908 family protein [Serratia sp. NPDC078593]|uniref:DUF5908 family protein n=1 Tax=unclassified Serratia (in: enterobacteria) TaxID=2647522 RepID=UPI0037D578CE